MVCFKCFRPVLCVVGLLLSAYALYVEVQKSNHVSYTALCDISERMSCSKVLTSRYSMGFGVVSPLLGDDSFLNLPNSVFGLVFYSLMLVLVSCLGSLYLACILVFVLQDICIVCVGIYVINLCLLAMDICGWMSQPKQTRVRKAD